ncbi:hypothetical protein IPS71_17245 [Xanthomonas perforans]|nr:hypothetical protein [Xanthomonas perforans]
MDELLGAANAEDLEWMFDEPDMMDMLLLALSMPRERDDHVMARFRANVKVDEQLTVVLKLLYTRPSFRAAMIRLVIRRYPKGQNLSDFQLVKLAECAAFIGDASCLENLMAFVEPGDRLLGAFVNAQIASNEACMCLLWPRCCDWAKLCMTKKEQADMATLYARECARRAREMLFWATPHARARAGQARL